MTLAFSCCSGVRLSSRSMSLGPPKRGGGPRRPSPHRATPTPVAAPARKMPSTINPDQRCSLRLVESVCMRRTHQGLEVGLGWHGIGLRPTRDLLIGVDRLHRTTISPHQHRSPSGHQQRQSHASEDGPSTKQRILQRRRRRRRSVNGCEHLLHLVLSTLWAAMWVQRRKIDSVFIHDRPPWWLLREMRASPCGQCADADETSPQRFQEPLQSLHVSNSPNRATEPLAFETH